jgi:hypothetical protein
MLAWPVVDHCHFVLTSIVALVIRCVETLDHTVATAYVFE